MATTYHSAIQQLYVAYFNRPADVAGLEYWDKVLSATNGDLSVVSTGFATSEEFVSRHLGMDNSTIYERIFQNMFGRALDIKGVDAGLTDGLNWSDEAVSHFAAKVAAADKTVLENKVKAALGFTGALDTPAEAAAYAGPAVLQAVKNFITSVTTAATLPASFDNVVADVLKAPAQGLMLTLGTDIVRGTDANDTFSAPLSGAAATLQSLDHIDGAGGVDRLNAELGNASAPLDLSSHALETVSIRAVANLGQSGTPDRPVQVDARFSAGTGEWESSRSSADLLIDSIGLLPTQVTKDATIVMQETNAGDVDFGAYFDSHAIRGNTPNVLHAQLMDTRNAASKGVPLAENPYDGFAVSYNGVVHKIVSPAIHAAHTYDALFAAFEAAVRANPALSEVTLTQGTFQIQDTLGTPLTGTDIIFNAPAGNEFRVSSQLGWIAEGAIPGPLFAALYTSDNTSAIASIVLDDVGRGLTGGDLEVGGSATSYSSWANGIPQFNIEVRDSSKLQTISSTGGLDKVVLKNGATSNHGSGPADQGDLSVLGTVGPIVIGAPNNGLPDVGTHSESGFSDVRVIDASAMRGKISFDADITDAVFYRGQFADWLKDIDILYSGGANDDSITVTIDGKVLAAEVSEQMVRGNAIFHANGGAGNDALAVIVNNGTAALGSNVILDGGTGNDTLRMEGNANAIVKVDTGFGNDKVIGFTAGTGTGADQLDFSALSGRATAFSGTTVSNADGAITVQLQTAANDSVADIAALYTDGSTATKHVFVAYDASNVGKVYSVVDGAASAVTVTLVGTIDLSDTSWNALVSANFI